MASGTFVPTFPAPAPYTAPVSVFGQDDSDGELTVEKPFPRVSPGHQFVNVMPAGRENDEELETLSIHERLVDEAHARSPETARRPPKEPTFVEPEVDFLQTEHGKILQERLSTLVAAFRDRSQKAKQIIMQPPPPEEKVKPVVAPPLPPPKSEDSAVKGPITDDKQAEKKPEEKKKPAPPPPPPGKSAVVVPPPPVRIKLWRKYYIPVPEIFFSIPRPPSFDSHSRMYLAWLLLVSVCFIYNAIVIPYRASFEDGLDDPYFYVWLIIDYTCDAIYLADLVIWKPAIRTYVNGIEELDNKEIMRKYVLDFEFKLDALSLLPLDFLYLIPGVGIKPLLRLPRLLKIFGYWEFLDRIDQVSKNPFNYYFRVLRSFSYMMYLIHANACVYYYFSYTYDFTANDQFVYNNNQPECQGPTPGPKCTFPGTYNAYIFCFFFSVSMVTIIGNFNFPGEVSEMLYSMVLWFLGVFVFATIVGQIRDVLKAMTRHEDDFYEVMDAIVEHMHTLKIPRELQDRVRSWLLFNWEQQKTIDERHLLDGLPNKLRSDLAMEVHFGVIHKVALFKGVDKKVLEELLMRLRPTVYLPQDYICKKGEIGKEMYIVKSGMLEVVLPDGRVAVTLGPGSVFGEISLLSLAGGNRRTADVRSKGFTNLYTLSKADLNEVMKDYPETLIQLKDKAQELMNKGKPPQDRPPTPPPIEVIPTRPPTPEMVRIALSVLKADSKIRRRLSQSAVELSYHAQEHEGSEDEDVEIKLATTDHAGTDAENRMQTPLPVPDVTAEILARQLAQEPARKPSSDSDGATKSIGTRRRRSHLNTPNQASSSDSDEGTAQGSRRGSSAARTRRKRGIRPSSQLTTSLTSKEIRDDMEPVSEIAYPPPEAVNIFETMPTPELRPRSPKPLGSLISLKRRFAGAPKVHPLEMDVEPANTPELLSPAPRPSVFAFDRKLSVPDPAQGRHGSVSHRLSTASFSDYEFTNYSDNFAGVTFSSDTETP